jgi:hypothetical protein
MGVVPDEVAVRQLFDQLTAGQPDAPPDRHSRIMRRVRRHRLAQVAGTLAVVAAAAAVAVGVGASVGTVPPVTGHRPVPAWALPWPDHRDGSVPQGVLDGAVTAWRHETALNGIPLSATSKAKVIWYVGQKVAEGQVVVVVFEVDSGAGRRLVAGWATASEVVHGQPGWKPGSSPWVSYDIAAPKRTRSLLIGLNVHGTSARQDRNPDNWIVVLADPHVQGVGWTAPRPSRTGTTSQGPSMAIGMTRAVRGLAIADTGQITGRVEVSQLEVHGRNILTRPGYVGVPGNAHSYVPQLAGTAPIPARPGFRISNSISGQGAISLDTDLSGYHGRLAIRARCDGPADLRLKYGHGARQILLGTVPCDDAVHELATSVRSSSHVFVTVRTSQLTAYQVVFGTIR